MRPPLPRTQEHCCVETEFGYFTAGGFTKRPAPTDSPATGDRQFNKQRQIQ